MAASQYERQAEVYHKFQMVWHLNMLPKGYVWSEGFKLR